MLNRSAPRPSELSENLFDFHLHAEIAGEYANVKAKREEGCL